MRLLSIGLPLPHVDIDNYNPFTAPSYFDYDALYVEPSAVTRFAAQVLDDNTAFEAFDNRPVVNAASTASAVSAGELLKRRLDETQRFLEAGGTVIVSARPNAVQSGIVGFEGCDRYSWLPAPAGMAWGPPYLRAAEGKTIRIVAEDHPFASYLRDFRRDLGYRAIFDDRQPPVRQHGRVFARGGAGSPIGVEFDVLAGRVIFLPAFPEETYNRAEMAERLLDAVRQVMRDSRAIEQPSWARDLFVPGLEDAESEAKGAEQASEEAQARLDAARERGDVLTSYRRLVTDDGRTLTDAARDAFALLGFGVLDSKDGPGLVIETEGITAFVECEGSRGEVVEWPYVRLQRRLEQRLLTEGDSPRGIVIANGYRFDPLDARTRPQFTEAVRLACENYRYALLTGETLFALVKGALAGASEGTLAGFRRKIMSRSGHIESDAALGLTEEPAESGPIF